MDKVCFLLNIFFLPLHSFHCTSLDMCLMQILVMINVFVRASSSHCDCMHLQTFMFSFDVISGLACWHVYYLFIYSNLFPYIPFRYIPWEWKESHSLYILRHLQFDTTNSRLEIVHKNHSYNLHNLTLYTEY